MPSPTLAIAIVVGASLLPIAIGYFSASLTRSVFWAVLFGVLAMLCASLRLWWFNIPDPLGRLPNDPGLQFELGQVTLIVVLVYGCLAAFFDQQEVRMKNCVARACTSAQTPRQEASAEVEPAPALPMWD